MRYYLAFPVLDEIQEGILSLYDQNVLASAQAVAVLNLIKGKVGAYNSSQKGIAICRCGRCLKRLTRGEVFSLEEEINHITKGAWWSEELEAEAAFDTVCADCRDFIMKKYL